MDLLIPFQTSFPKDLTESINMVIQLSFQKIKKKHLILHICGLSTLNIHEEKRDSFVSANDKIFYCVRDAKNFVIDDLKFAHVSIAQQYFKICSFAFLLGIGKDCFLKNNKLTMYNVTDQEINNIVPNILHILSPKDLMVVVNDVYKRLDNLEQCNFISNDMKLIMKDKYQKQLINDMF